MKSSGTVRSGLFLLGSFAFAYNAQVALHECSHAVAMMLTGAGVSTISLHPFSWSFAMAATAPTHPSGGPIISWAGPLGGAAIGLVLLFVLWRWRSPRLFPVLLLGAMGLVHNGSYLVIDALLAGGGDATHLMAMGTPLWLLIIVGVPLFLAGVMVSIAILPLAGLRASDSIGHWIATLSLGIMPYLIAMMLFQLISGSNDVHRWLLKLGGGMAAVPLVAAVAPALLRRAAQTRHAASPSWALAHFTLAVGMAIVVAELVFSAHPWAP